MDGLSITRAARERASSVAWVSAEGEATFADVAARVACARGSLAARGVLSGQVVALRAEPTAATLTTLLALWESGCTAALLHPRLTQPEIDRLRSTAKPAHTLGAAELADAASFDDAMHARPAKVSAESPAALVWTSGSSGSAKGVLLPRRAFVAGAQGLAALHPWQPHDRWLLCMPLAHVGGLSIVTRALVARQPIVVAPRFDVAEVVTAIRRHHVTRLSVVPTMLAALLDAGADDALRQLSLVLVGGAAASPALLRECARRKIAAVTTYGLSESCSMATVQRPGETNRAGCGVALPQVELAIRSAHGDRAGAGEQGRICLRGPTLMSGYLGHAPLDGWLDTQDLGCVEDDGTLHVRGRASDLIITGGENVAPAEVEEALLRSAAVREALVFGVADERWGQVVSALLVPAAADLDERALLEALRGELASFKLPRRVCVTAALPRLSSGKVDRARSIREHAGSLRPWR